MKFIFINVLLLLFESKSKHFRKGSIELNVSNDALEEMLDEPGMEEEGHDSEQGLGRGSGKLNSSDDALNAVIDDPDMEDEDDDFVSGLEKYAEDDDVVILKASNATVNNATIMAAGQAFGTSAADMFRSKDSEVAVDGRPRKLRGRAFWPENWKAWYRKNKGNDGPGKPLAPMWVMKNNHIQSFAVCTPPKNGCSRWKRLLRRIQGFKDYMRDPHNWRTAGLVMAGRQSVGFQHKLWTKPIIFKIILARNPLERLLSAWLSKKKVFKLPLDFGKFTTMLDVKKWAGKDVHWKPQTFLCDSPGKGFHYDFIAKVEDRDIWMGKLENFLSIKRYTSTGWGENRLQRFSQAESKIGSVDTGATKLKILQRYYTPEIFKRVCRYYKNDIRDLGYEKDVQGLWKDVFQGKHGPLHY